MSDRFKDGLICHQETRSRGLSLDYMTYTIHLYTCLAASMWDYLVPFLFIFVLLLSLFLQVINTIGDITSIRYRCCYEYNCKEWIKHSVRGGL